MDRRLWPLLGATFVAGALAGIVLATTRAILADKSVGSRAGTPEQLGTRILGRVAHGFIASRRTPSNGGFLFYDQPLPYAESLCRTNAYFVPEHVVTGKLDRPQDRWEDKLRIETRYGVWRPVGRGEGNSREKACAAFRDFDNMFTAEGDPPEPERAVFLLDALVTAARGSGPLPFPVTCRRYSKGEPHGRPCDGRNLLRDLSVRGLRHARMVSFSYGREFGDSVDALSLPTPPAAEQAGSMQLMVASRQHWGRDSVSEGEVKSVSVRIEAGR
jgi:hypothetical protein